MLPKIAKLQFETTDVIETPEVHSTYEWDFKNGEFITVDGKLQEVTELDYIKTWIEKILRTRFGFDIYSSYGSGHHNLIGSVYDRDFVQAEVTRMIREALLINKAILEIGEVDVDFEGSELTIRFDIKTIYGHTEVII